MEPPLIRTNSEKYKWAIAGMCMLILCVGLGFCSTAKNIYISPVTKAFGFLRSAYTINDTCRYVTVSVATLFFYKLVQKFGTKKLILAGMIFYTVSSLLNAFATSLWGFYLAGIFLGLGVTFTSTTMISLVINTWFNKNQGTVLGIVLASNAIGSAIAVNVLTPIIYQEGNPFAFRKAYLLTALLIIITMFIFAFFYREKGTYTKKQKNEASTENEASGLKFAAILKLPQFYITLFCFLLFALTSVPVLAPYLDDIGFDPAFVASMLSISSVALAVSKILIGIIYDRFGIRTALNVCLISSAISKLLLFMINLSPVGKVLAVLHCLLSGLGTTLETVMIPITATALFGKKSFVRIISFTSVASTIGYAFCSPLANLPYDISGSYTITFVIALISCIAMIFAMNMVVTSMKTKKQ